MVRRGSEKDRNPDEMYYKPLAEKVRHYKGNGKGEEEMSGVFEEFREEIQEENARELIKNNVSLEIIARCLKMSLEKVNQLAKQEQTLV